jgi:polysaccharide export outer membrane protein
MMVFQFARSTVTLQRFALAALVTAGCWSTPVRGAVQQSSASQAQPALSASPAGERLQWSHGERYRLTPTDVIELTFPYVPEFDQVLTVQPDGYVTLKAVGELRAQGRTLPELRALLVEKYAPVLRDPVITIVLKEFEKPYYVAAGEVNKPGKFELRGATSVTQALAIAGGLTEKGKSSEVILFRRFSEDLLEVKKINVSKMFSRRDLSEDPLLRPGDTLFVPKSLLARIQPFIPLPQLGLYLNPFQVWR